MSEMTSESFWFYFYKYDSSTVLKKKTTKAKPFVAHFQTLIIAYKISHQN